MESNFVVIVLPLEVTSYVKGVSGSQQHSINRAAFMMSDMRYGNKLEKNAVHFLLLSALINNPFHP